jgi:hypothetical protein
MIGTNPAKQFTGAAFTLTVCPDPPTMIVMLAGVAVSEKSG